jgi:hypothetical protein
MTLVCLAHKLLGEYEFTLRFFFGLVPEVMVHLERPAPLRPVGLTSDEEDAAASDAERATPAFRARMEAQPAAEAKLREKRRDERRRRIHRARRDYAEAVKTSQRAQPTGRGTCLAWRLSALVRLESEFLSAARWGDVPTAPRPTQQPPLTTACSTRGGLYSSTAPSAFYRTDATGGLGGAVFPHPATGFPGVMPYAHHSTPHFSQHVQGPVAGNALNAARAAAGTGSGVFSSSGCGSPKNEKSLSLGAAVSAQPFAAAMAALLPFDCAVVYNALRQFHNLSPEEEQLQRRLPDLLAQRWQ